MNIIIDTVFSNLPRKRKTTPSGWHSFNAVCCHNTGNSRDTRNRGGIIQNGDSVSYHCFNCQFKTSWQPGRTLSPKFKKFLKWLGVSDDLITKCHFESLKLKDELVDRQLEKSSNFTERSLPDQCFHLKEWASRTLDNQNAENFYNVIQYLMNRGFPNPFEKDFYWSPNYQDRVIIPFRYQDKIVGYTARKIKEGKPKYISEQQPGYVFNLDNQEDCRRFVIICEGPFDAISIEGVAILGSEISLNQKRLIDKLERPVIVVPDRDHEGHKLIEQAIEFGWSVSFPDWDDLKDINEAVIKYGKTLCLYKILNNVESNELKIKLLSKNWLKGKNI